MSRAVRKTVNFGRTGSLTAERKFARDSYNPAKSAVVRFLCLCKKSHLGLGKEQGSGWNFCLDQRGSMEQSVSENLMVVQILVIQTEEANSM